MLISATSPGQMPASGAKKRLLLRPEVGEVALPHLDHLGRSRLAARQGTQ